MKHALTITGLTVALMCAVAAQLGAAGHAREGATTTSTNELHFGTHVAHTAQAVQDETTAAVSAREWRWRGALAAGRAIEIKGINGNVRAEDSTGSEVEVVAERRGHRSNPDEVRLEVVEHGGGVTICAVYPNANPNRPNTCEPGEGGHSSVHDNDVQVEFTVRVPAGVNFRGRTVNGAVEARGISGDVEARTVNGNVRVNASGLVRAGTVNGSITASMGRANWSSGLEFETVNGGIDLSFPTGLNTEVHAETVNGVITSDFPVTVQGRFTKRHLDGLIGSGGRELRLKTVNGNVQIRRAS